MRIAGYAYVLSAAITLVAMASRAGWVNWPVVGHVATVVMAMAVGLLTFLALIALLVGVPSMIIIALVEGLRKLFPAKPTEGPPA